MARLGDLLSPYDIPISINKIMEISNRLNDLNAFNETREMFQTANQSIVDCIDSNYGLPNICKLIQAFKM